MAVDLDVVRALVESRVESRQSAYPSTDEIVHPGQLPMEWRIDWEERAAILQYDGEHSREEAEREALREIMDRPRRSGDASAYGQTPRGITGTH